MTTIRTVIRNGQINISVPNAFQDGTEVLVQVTPVAEFDDLDDRQWDNSPEGVADWLTWYDSLEPLVLTEEELRQQRVDREKRKAWEHAQFNDHADRLAQSWE